MTSISRVSTACCLAITLCALVLPVFEMSACLLRKPRLIQVNELLIMATEEMQLDPLSGALFLFRNFNSCGSLT